MCVCDFDCKNGREHVCVCACACACVCVGVCVCTCVCVLMAFEWNRTLLLLFMRNHDCNQFNVSWNKTLRFEPLKNKKHSLNFLSCFFLSVFHFWFNCTESNSAAAAAAVAAVAAAGAAMSI